MRTDRFATAPLRSSSAARRTITFLPVLAGLLASAAVQAADYDHHVRLTPANSVIGNYPAQKAPILTIKSGDTVRIDGGGGNRWGEQEPLVWMQEQGITLTPDQRVAVEEIQRVLKETERYAGIQNGHLIVGPIAIEGAMPGDSVEIRIHSVAPRIPYGGVGMRPGAGGIPDAVPKPYTKIVKLDLERNVGLFEPGIEVPLAPFQGVMGMLPPLTEGTNRRSGPPGLFGGNLDCKELVDGTTLFLPVFHPGGLFFTGDSHAAQGDGEVSINAIETANTSVLQFILHKGRTLQAPRAETPTHYIAFGLDPDLDNAMTMAIHETNALLGEVAGLDFYRAFALSSIGIDFRVTQVVDETKGIHSMIAKSLFLDKKRSYWLQTRR